MSYIRDIIKKIIKEVNEYEQYWNQKEQNDKKFRPELGGEEIDVPAYEEIFLGA